MAFIKVVNRKRYFLTFPFSNSCFNQNDSEHFLSFFFPSSFTIHKIYSVKGCYKLLLPPAVPWPGGFLCPRLMDMAASCPLAGSTSSKAECVSLSHTQKPPPGPAIEKAPTPTAQPNASRTHVSTESPVPTSSRAGRDRRSPLWAHNWHPPTPQVPSSPSPVLTANRHPPVPQASHTCRCPQLPAQTRGGLQARYPWSRLIPLPRPRASYRLLSSAWSSLVNTGEDPVWGWYGHTPPLHRHTGCEPWSRSSHQHWAPRPGASGSWFLGHTPFLPSSWKTPTHPVAGTLVQGHLHPWSGSSSWHPVQLRQSPQ